MDDVGIRKGLSDEDLRKVCQWTNVRSADFLQQWAGAALEFPLTETQLNTQEGLYSFYYLEEFLGCVQKMRVEDNNAHIGRLIINPEMTGKGLGGEAFKQFMELLKSDEKINSVTLMVYDYNKPAKGLYEKNGFTICETIEKPIKCYKMIKNNVV